jgi:hypothetical protein
MADMIIGSLPPILPGIRGDIALHWGPAGVPLG